LFTIIGRKTQRDDEKMTSFGKAGRQYCIFIIWVNTHNLTG